MRLPTILVGVFLVVVLLAAGLCVTDMRLESCTSLGALKS